MDCCFTTVMRVCCAYAALAASPISAAEYQLDREHRLKIPDDLAKDRPVRGVFVHNIFEGGRRLYAAEEKEPSVTEPWEALAVELNCAQMICSTKPAAGRDQVRSRDDASVVAVRLARQLEKFADLTGRPEIAKAPLVLTGLSAAGGAALWIGNEMRDRVIAVIPHHGISGSAFVQAEMSSRSPMHSIPVLYVIAGSDTERNAGIQTFIEAVRKHGGLWTTVLQPNVPHHRMGDQAFVVVWLREVFNMRVPAVGGNQGLRSLDELSWVASYTLDSSGPAGAPFHAQYCFKDPKIGASGELKSPLNKTIWLPNERTARAWRAYAITGQVDENLRGP